MTKQLVEQHNDQIVTTSIQVAKDFGKAHRTVLRNIRDLFDKGSAQKVRDLSKMFLKDEYVEKQNNQKYPMYYMNKDGFTLLAMGFTGRKALKFKLQYIDAFNDMDKTIREGNLGSYRIEDPIKRAEKWIQEQQHAKELESQVKVLKPKAIFADAVSSSKGTILVGELAKLLRQNGVKIGAMRLFTWLRNNGYLIKRKGVDYNTPTQRSMELGLFEVRETVVAQSNGHTRANYTPRVTGKGQQYFINKLTRSLQHAN